MEYGFQTVQKVIMDKFVVSLPKNRKRNVDDKDNRSNYHSITRKPVKTLKSSQMYLDLGQKSFGSHTTCKKCSMFYLIGDIDDEKRHSSHCFKVADPIISLVLAFLLHIPVVAVIESRDFAKPRWPSSLA